MSKKPSQQKQASNIESASLRYPEVNEIIANLGDRKWRLNTLYYVKNEQGEKQQFKLRPIQEFLLDNLWYFNLIPKSRQLGITTFACILFLDAILFSENQEAAIIVHRLEDQKKIFNNKIKFAWNHLHPWLKAKFGEPDANNACELRWTGEGQHGGVISTTMTNRGGTVQYLHVSEYNYVCRHSPDRAEEIMTGALQTVHKGAIVIIESTGGGQDGYFYDLCMKAKQQQDSRTPLTPLDYKLFFFPWHVDPKCAIDPKGIVFTKEDEDYFDKLTRKEKITLSPAQKAFYIKKKNTLKDKMFAEYPSTFSEVFLATIEGAYYQNEMNKVFEQNRVRPVIHNPLYEVDTWWDLGMHDDMVVILTQTVGDEIRFLDIHVNNRLPLAHYYDWLVQQKDKYGYRYGFHHLPHDVEVDELQSGVSRKQHLYNLGMRNIRVGQKIPISDGIERVRTLFPRFVFDESKCDRLVNSLVSYRRDYDKKLGTFRDSPRHDRSSHVADAVRLLGELWRPRMATYLQDEATNEKDVQAFFS